MFNLHSGTDRLLKITQLTLNEKKKTLSGFKFETRLLIGMKHKT